MCSPRMKTAGPDVGAMGGNDGSWCVHEEPFSVRNNRGERLCALLCKSDASDKQPRTVYQQFSQRVAIIAHGYRDSKRGIFVERLSRALLPRQTIRFDMSGNGESEGKFQFGNYQDEVEDIRAVVEHARNVMHLHVDCIIGHR